MKIPVETTFLGIPEEFIKKILTIPRFFDLRDFQHLENHEFQDRLLNEISRSYRTSEPYPVGRSYLLPDAKIGEIQTGTVVLNLERYQNWGDPGNVIFKIRESGHPWQTHKSNKDKVVKMILPVGQYYLQIGKTIKKAFILAWGKSIEVRIN